MYNQLHQSLKKECPDYPDEEFNMLIQRIIIKEHPKKTILIKEGNVCQFGSYVVKGCFRYYTTNQEGAEFIINFAFEDWWVGDIYSMLNNTPAKFTLQALDECTLMMIGAADFKYLLDHSPFFSKFKQIKRDRAYQSALTRSTDIRESADSKYDKMLERFPEANQRIPQYYLASYLGITPESLSRIRKSRSR